MVIPENMTLFKYILANTIQKNPNNTQRGCLISPNAAIAPGKLNKNGPKGGIKVPINCSIITIAIPVPTIDKAARSKILARACQKYPNPPHEPFSHLI